MSEYSHLYDCRRIKSRVYAERNHDNGNLIVSCSYYTTSGFGENRCPCIKDAPKFKKCLVKKAAEKREPSEKSKLVSE